MTEFLSVFRYRITVEPIVREHRDYKFEEPAGITKITIVTGSQPETVMVGIPLTQVAPTACGLALAFPGEVGWTIRS